MLRRLDLIVLRPDASRAEIERLCRQAREHECLAVCVPGSRVALAAAILEESTVKVSALIGFPFGTSDSDTKRFEIEAAIDAGAQEFDVVVNPGMLRDQDDRRLLRELRDLREAADERPVKAILELALLSREEMIRGAQSIREAELQFAVTATGCGSRATRPEDVGDLREAAGEELGLKAVGGITTPADAEALVAAGANRLGVFDLKPFLPVD